MAIGYVGSASAAGSTTTSTTAAVTVPAGSNGDLLIFNACLSSPSTGGSKAGVITVPTLTKLQDIHTVTNHSAIFFRFVQAGDASSYTFTASAGAALTVTCTRYSGVSKIRGYKLAALVAGISTAVTSYNLPSSENVNSSDLVIACVSYGRNAAGTTISAISTPSGWTQRVTKTGPTLSTAYAITAAQYERSAATDTPSFTGSAGMWAAYAIVLSDGTQPDITGGPPQFIGASTAATVATNLKTITVNKPSGVVDNHLLLMAVISGDGVASFTPPSGWTSLGIATAAFGMGTTSSAFDGSAQLWYKFASSEPASYTVTTTGAQEIAAVVVAYSGVRNAYPVTFAASTSQYSGTASPTTTSPAPFAIPNVSSDSVVVNFYTGGGDTTGTYTVTAPSSPWTQRAQVITAVASDFNASITVSEKQGATDQPTASSSKALGWCVFSAALVGSPVPRLSTAMTCF